MATALQDEDVGIGKPLSDADVGLEAINPKAIAPWLFPNEAPPPPSLTPVAAPASSQGGLATVEPYQTKPIPPISGTVERQPVIGPQPPPQEAPPIPPPFVSPTRITAEGPEYPPFPTPERSIYEEPTFTDKALAYPGNVIRAIPADVAETIAGNEPYYELHNLAAAALNEPLPIDEALKEASSESKTWATVGKISQGLAATAPMLAIGHLPEAAQQFALAAFTAQMLKDAPEVASQLGEELGKPKDQQDPDKITSLLSDAIQITGFAPAGALGLHRAMMPKPFQGPLATGELLKGPRGALPPGGPPPPEIVSPEAARAAADRMTREVAGGVSPRPIPAPFVPATAPEPERGLNVLEEIRQRGLRTKQAIIDAFPNRNLTREEAADLRKQAWGEKPETAPIPEPGAPAAAAEKPPVKIERFGALRGDGPVPDRPMVIVNVDGQPIVFYRSAMGTSGKGEGNWYPVFGVGNGEWFIKGHTSEMEGGYGKPGLKSVMDSLNQQFSGMSADQVMKALGAEHGEPLGSRQISIEAYGDKGHSPHIYPGDVEAANAHIATILDTLKGGKSAAAPAEIANRLGIKFRGTMKGPSATNDQYVDANGVTVTVPAGSSHEVVDKKLYERRREYAQGVADEIGFTLSPKRNLGAARIEGLPQEYLDQMLASGQKYTWEFTDLRKGSPTQALTFYVPEDASPNQIRDIYKAKLKEFGVTPPEPAEPPTVTHIDPNVAPAGEVPIDQIVVHKDIPNFKEAADQTTGVVPSEKLESQRYERLGTAPIVLWRKNNGELEVITGRHRLDLAKRTGEKTIPAQIVEESKGFTKEMAMTFDAEANIRDGQGSVRDYAHYFKGSPDLTEGEARQRGLLSRAKGKAGWDMAKAASDDLYALWRDDKITEAKALAIARAAPGDAAKQQLGIKLAQDGKPADFIRARLERERAKTEAPTQTDMFGNPVFDDAKADAEANRVAQIRRDITDQIRAVQAAAKNPEAAAKLGVDVKDPAGVLKRVDELKAELQRWDGAWWLDPELVAKAKGEQPPPSPPGAAPAPAPPVPKPKGPAPASGSKTDLYDRLKKSIPGEAGNPIFLEELRGTIQKHVARGELTEAQGRELEALRRESLSPNFSRDLNEIWDKFDNTGEIQTGRDLANAIGDLVSNFPGDPRAERLGEALDRYNEELKDAKEYGERGGVEEEAEDAFKQAVQEALKPDLNEHDAIQSELGSLRQLLKDVKKSEGPRGQIKQIEERIAKLESRLQEIRGKKGQAPVPEPGDATYNRLLERGKKSYTGAYKEGQRVIYTPDAEVDAFTGKKTKGPVEGEVFFAGDDKAKVYSVKLDQGGERYMVPESSLRPVEGKVPPPPEPGEPMMYGVPKSQWEEMAKYNDREQMERWGTTRAKLMEAEILGKKPKAKPAKPGTEPAFAGNVSGRSVDFPSKTAAEDWIAKQQGRPGFSDYEVKIYKMGEHRFDVSYVRGLRSGETAVFVGSNYVDLPSGLITDLNDFIQRSKVAEGKNQVDVMAPDGSGISIQRSGTQLYITAQLDPIKGVPTPVRNVGSTMTRAKVIKTIKDILKSEKKAPEAAPLPDYGLKPGTVGWANISYYRLRDVLDAGKWEDGRPVTAADRAAIDQRLEAVKGVWKKQFERGIEKLDQREQEEMPMFPELRKKEIRSFDDYLAAIDQARSKDKAFDANMRAKGDMYRQIVQEETTPEQFDEFQKYYDRLAAQAPAMKNPAAYADFWHTKLRDDVRKLPASVETNNAIAEEVKRRMSGQGPAEKGETKQPFFKPEEQARVDAIKAKIKAKLNPLPGEAGPKFSGAPLDPELFDLGAELAVHYIRAGVRRFNDFATHMINDLGESAKDYLLSWYSNAKITLSDIAHELDDEPTAQRSYQERFGKRDQGRSEVSGPVRGSGAPGGRPGIRISRQELIPEPRQHVNADSYAARSGFRLDEQQVRGINLIIDRFLSAVRGGFVLADGTGFGKTAQMLAVADQYIKRFGGKVVSWQDKARNFYDNSDWEARTKWLGGDNKTARDAAARAIHFDELNAGQKQVVAKNLGIDPSAPPTGGKNPRVLVVTQNKQILEMRFKGDAERMGIDPNEITLTTYTSLGKLPPGVEWDLVIFDEAHNLKNPDAQKSVKAAHLDTKHTLFGTATPMDRPTGAAYFLAEITGRSEAEIAKDLGYSLVAREDPITHKPYQSAVLLPGFSWPKVWANIMSHRDAAIKAGAMIRREYPFFGDVNVDRMEMSRTDKTEHDSIVRHFDALIAKVRNPTAKRNFAGQKTLELGRWAEQVKLHKAVEMAVDHINKGGQAIIVCETDKPQSFSQPVRDSEKKYVTSETTGRTKEVWVTDGAITKVKRMLAERGITDIADIHDPKSNDIPLQVRKFQSGEARVALATPQSGGTGVDLDDSVGNRPRLMIALSKNMAGDAFEQLVGRVSRKNTKSPSQVKFLDLTGAFGDQRRNAILDTKIKTLRAIQGGEDLDVSGGFNPGGPGDAGGAGGGVVGAGGKRGLPPAGGGTGMLLDAPPEGAQKKIGGMSPKEVQALLDQANPNNRLMYSGIPVPDVGAIWDAIKEAAPEIGPEVRRAWRSFSMQTLPRITDSHRPAGEAGARYAASPMVARAKGIQFASEVTDGIRTPDFDKKFGTGLTEDNLRDLKRVWNEKADEAENRDELIQQFREQISDLADSANDGDPVAVSEIRHMRSEIRRLSKLTDADVAIFRQNADNVTTTIGAPNSPFATEAEYRAFMDSPETQGALRKHIALWQTDKEPLYREAADIDPEVELQTRGLDYGARINLKNVLRDQGTPTTVGPAVRSPLIRATATLRRRDPFAQAAMGAGSYEGSYAEIMANGFGREYPVAKQHEFIRQLLEGGDAKITSREFEPELEIKGESTKGYPLRIRPWANRFIQIRKSLAPEFEDASGLSAQQKLGLYSKAADVLTRSSVQGLAEGSTHVSNLMMQLFTGVGPTADPMINALMKSLGRADLLYSLPKVFIGAFADRKADMLKLAEIGAAKEPYRGAVGWLITKVDHGVRLYAADVYQKMAAKGIVPDTETGLREFVNQVGQYNKRLQPRWIQILRSTGIQPFATAMQTFNVQGLRTMAADPGVKGASTAAALALRADKAASIIGFAVLVTSLNYLISGTATGPAGTKLGAVGWVGDDKRLHQLDLGALTGISRGARITGLQGYAEAKRLGLPTSAATMAGAQGAANTMLSAATGPMNRFLFLAATGKRPAIPPVQESPVVAPQKEFSALKSQVAANIIEAAKQANPIVDAAVRVKQGKYQEALSRQLSRYTPKVGMGTEQIQNLPKIVQASELKTYVEAVAKEARKQPASYQRIDYVRERFKNDALDPDLQAKAMQQLRRMGVFK